MTFTVLIIHIICQESFLNRVIIDIEAFLKYAKVSNLPKVQITVKSITCVLENLAAW